MELAVIMGPEPGVPAEQVLRLQRTQAGTLAAALADRGHDVTVYVPGRDGGLDDLARERVLAAAARIETAPASVSSPADFGAFLARSWDPGVPGLVYATGTSSGLAALEAAGDRPLALVQDARGAAPPEHPDALYPYAQRVLAISADHSALLVRMGIAHHKLAVMPYGSTTAGLAPAEDLRPGRGPRRLVCPDGPGSTQGAADIVAALPWLPDARLVIAGGPAPVAVEADRDVRRIRELATRVGVADRVELVGRLPDADLGALYAGADVVVSVPLRPNAGLTCLDAMACGACVVATALGGARDAVLHGITGLLVPPAEPRALARALRTLLAQPTLITSFGFAAADRARSRYGWEQLAQEGERVFNEAVRLAGIWPDALSFDGGAGGAPLDAAVSPAP
jgi:glycosyltransferase involved in cell wall biosynthesis